MPPCTESHQPMQVRSGLIRESPAQGSVSSPRSWPYEADLGIRSWQVVVREFSAAASQHSQALLIPKLQMALTTEVAAVIVAVKGLTSLGSQCGMWSICWKLGHLAWCCPFQHTAPWSFYYGFCSDTMSEIFDAFRNLESRHRLCAARRQLSFSFSCALLVFVTRVL